MEAWTVGKELGGKRWRALVGRIRVRGPVCGGSTKVVPIGFRPGHHALTDRWVDFACLNRAEDEEGEEGGVGRREGTESREGVEGQKGRGRKELRR